MNKSLKYFVSVWERTKNLDKNGQSKTPLKVTYNINRYDPNNVINGDGDINANGKQETKTVNYSVIKSLFGDNVLNYQGNSTTNDYIPFNSLPEHESDISLSSIIKWTQDNHPSMKLDFPDIAYLKDFNKYPANRFLILRRFESPVPDNIFNVKSTALNTLVTYFDFEKNPLKITFKENWESYNGTVADLLQNIVGVDSNNSVGKALSLPNSSNFSQEITGLIAQSLGLVSSGELPYGDPNIIYESIIRKTTGEPDDIQSGLNSSIEIDFEATYSFKELPEIPNYDGKMAMVDMIANIFSMGTSNSKFFLTDKAEGIMNKVISQLEDGKIDEFLKDILSGLSTLIEKASTALVDLVTNPSDAGKKISNVLISILKIRIQRYKWKLRGAIANLTGMYTAPWHITMGNPKYPFFTIGNLYIETASLDVGGEMSYSDTPTEIYVKYKLKAGRSLGSNELSSLFNSGVGRIYDKPDAIQKVFIPKDQEFKIPGKASDITENNSQNNNIGETSSNSTPDANIINKTEIDNSLKDIINTTTIEDNEPNIDPFITQQQFLSKEEQAKTDAFNTL